MACRLADSMLLSKGPYHKPIRSQRLGAHCSSGIYSLKWDNLFQQGSKRQQCSFRNQRTFVQAIAIPVAPSSPDSAEYRKQLSENYGFRQIGEPLPDTVTLKDIIDTLPKKVFEIDDVKAWKAVLISATSYALGLFMISKSPWYLLPLAWAWTGTAVTGHLNRWLVHFNLKKFRTSEVKRAAISLACVFAFMGIGWPLIVYKMGIMGWVKFWLMPWLGYHFWMSTFTMVHHTAPHIPFKSAEEWNAAQAQLNGTVHCDYPSWIEILCHDINVHIPHHISPRIPSYNLRAAHKSIQENWGKYLNEATWNWRLMKTIMTVCHVYNKEENYVPFDELAPEDSLPITILKKVMPDYA
ncbi:omega-6 fatty acid desaturase, chloroplastic isoform X2 [Argentina anserina]|uniref:omega-6 fatty acid desaturase, chloroplastic isoform X2 n=1 Tax=Argentina anserina TaxID=57926 RepID=UPI0021764DDC|nr:omega-6 fatty acid desaturase, chloroplastic isoform X2 [Potentilla anserina]